MVEEPQRVGIILPPPLLLDPGAVSEAPGSSLAAVDFCRGIVRCASEEKQVWLFVHERDLAGFRRHVHTIVPISREETTPVRVLPVSAIAPSVRRQPLLALHDVRGPWFDTVVWARSLLATQSCPVTCTCYGTSYQEFLHLFIARVLLVPTYACDAMICATELARSAVASTLKRLRDILQRGYGLPARPLFQLPLVPHFTDTGRFKPRERAEVRRELELPLEATIVLYVGRIDPSSKADVVPMLLAFKNVVNRSSGRPVLLLVGPTSSHTPNLDHLVSALGLTGHVLHRARVPHASVPFYYSAADIFVSFSDTLQENFGRTPVEAMASGLPVVVSDWAGYRETVLHEQTGFRIRTQWSACDTDLCLLAPFCNWDLDHLRLAQSVSVDIPAASEYLHVLVENPELRCAMGQRAREHVLACLSAEKCSEMMWRVWRELSVASASLPPLPPQSSRLVQPCYYDDFKGFASSSLELQTAVAPTETGAMVISGTLGLPLEGDTRALLDRELSIRILELIGRCADEDSAVPVRSVEDLLGQRGIDSNTVRQHLMWMLKHGLLSIDCEPRP